MNGFGLLLLIVAVLMVAANYMHEGRVLTSDQRPSPSVTNDCDEE